MADECDATDARAEIQERLERRAKENFKPSVEADCYECGVFIPIARQEATGGTDMCIECQSKEEIRLKAYQ